MLQGQLPLLASNWPQPAGARLQQEDGEHNEKNRQARYGQPRAHYEASVVMFVKGIVVLSSLVHHSPPHPSIRVMPKPSRGECPASLITKIEAMDCPLACASQSLIAITAFFPAAD